MPGFATCDVDSPDRGWGHSHRSEAPISIPASTARATKSPDARFSYPKDTGRALMMSYVVAGRDKFPDRGGGAPSPRSPTARATKSPDARFSYPEMPVAL
jgi:hypothetical protein